MSSLPFDLAALTAAHVALTALSLSPNELIRAIGGELTHQPSRLAKRLAPQLAGWDAIGARAVVITWDAHSKLALTVLVVELEEAVAALPMTPVRARLERYLAPLRATLACFESELIELLVRLESEFGDSPLEDAAAAVRVALCAGEPEEVELAARDAVRGIASAIRQQPDVELDLHECGEEVASGFVLALERAVRGAMQSVEAETSA